MTQVIHSTEFLKSELERLQVVLFECRYECRIRQRDLYDVDYLQNVGLPSSGIAWLDQEMDNQLVDMFLTINKMTECVKNGYNFYINYPETYAGIIYKAITDYIRYYGELSDRFPNLPLPDQDDFEILDQTASKIYTVYRCYEKPEELSGIVGRLRRRRRSFDLQNPVAEVELQRDEDGNVIAKEHNSMLDMFADRMTVKRIPKHEFGEE
ncbi:hypothetical protein RAY_306 [Erwinia phage vB_EamM_RAY]|jgi:hypothetical protein|uniref:Uncharacterized protein n=10 Tax=Agricanvirus TaxID=1984776 RepID=A0A173GER3_9CAUD|nr:hypothetical protein Ea357_302 [Erwinia phage Ea35-70]YP_009605455.1 hypothetical protein FDH97_gp312 [Erwinia phage vB_EamM_Deimos-Minion]YP_009605772.1 hypothetical protein FDH98_gp212 [Erwinia phage vB_EamM_RAY]YP_009606094.1 hypothetical protein FDH99_gp215 [Erwinia phage vB_EamM_Simmy50]YP_009606415.1 hypothetical protein FDI00_gp309 [Erwinia phage vB_EamM_Special G]YP_009622049.1 hypothetical protein FDJ23_gp308 [Erwinia phage vB_EamM_Desertfox]AUG86095.1 hypothetical protein BOSOLAP